MRRLFSIATGLGVSLLLLGTAGPVAAGDVKANPFDPGDLFEPENLGKTFTQAERAVAAELNVELSKQPRFLLSSRKHMVSVFMRELPDQIAKQSPERAGDKAFLRQQAVNASRGVLGFYEARRHTVHIVPENFIGNAQAMKDPAFLDPLFLKTVLVHELVHAWDQDRYDIIDRANEAEGAGEYRVWYALIEGHAQYVTERVMARFRANKQFYRYSRSQWETPPGVDPSMQHQAEVRARRNRFGYVDGHRFFQRLSEMARPNFVDDVFTRLPANPSVILHPERYYHPVKRPPALDYETSLRVVMSKRLPGWKLEPALFDEAILQATFGTLIDERKVQAMGSRFVGGNMMVATPPKGSGGVAVCTAVQMETERSARGLLEMMLDLQDAEEQAMAESGGAAKTTFRDRIELIPGSHLPHRRQVRIIELGPRVITHHWFGFAKGPVYGECLFEGAPQTDPELTGMLQDFVKQLKAAVALEVLKRSRDE